MAIPTVVNVGAVLNTTTSGTPGIPSSTQDADVLLLFISQSGAGTPGVSGGNQTWTQKAYVDTGTVDHYVYWARRGATAPTAPTVTNNSSGLTARMIAFRGCVASGDPFDATQTSSDGTSDTSGSATGLTTNGSDRLIVISEGGYSGSWGSTGTVEYSAWTNSNLANVTERIDNSYDYEGGAERAVTQGVATGELATSGATGATTFTHAHSCYKAMFVGALKPPSTPVDGTAQTLKWDLSAAIDASASTLKWDVRTPVDGIVLDLVWDVAQGGTVDAAPLTLKWDIGGLEPVDGTVLDLVWDTPAAVASALTLVWSMYGMAATEPELLPSRLAIELIVDTTSIGFNPYVVSDDSQANAAADQSGVGTKTWSNPNNAKAHDGSGATVSLGTTQTITHYEYEDQQVEHNESETQAPGAGANYDIGAPNNWSDTGFIEAQDGYFAVAQMGATAATNFLRAYAFGFSTQGTIDGFTARIRRKVLVGGTNVSDNVVKIGNHPNLYSGNHAASGYWTASWVTKSYGSSTDKWGGSPTPAVVNGNAFSLYIGAHSGQLGDGADVDYMELTVYYTWIETVQVVIDQWDEVVTSPETSHYLQLTDFTGFDSIPGDAEITGIRVTVTARSTSLTTADGTFNEAVADNRISLIKGGTMQAQNKALAAALQQDTYGPRTYGGPGDLWGSPWTVADVQASNFGVALALTGGPAIADVDDIRVSVYYVQAGQGAVVTGSPTIRFSADEEEPDKRPSSASFSTVMPGGYNEGDFSIARPEYFDPQDYLNGRVRFYEYETGNTWYEGRIVGASDTDEEASFELEGYARSLEDNKAAKMIFVDRDMNSWGGASVQYKLNRNASKYMVSDASVSPDTDTGAPALTMTLTSPWDATNGLPESLAVYDAHQAIAAIDYAWKKSSSVPSAGAEHWKIGAGATDTLSDSTSSSDLRATGPGSGTLTPSGSVKKYAWVQLYADAADATDGAAYSIYWTMLVVIGAHGLTLQGSVSAPANGRGVLASDVVEFVVGEFAPLLGIGDIEVSTFAIPHLTFREETTALNMIESVCLFGGDSFLPLDWWVGTDRLLHLASPENHGNTWRVRLSDGAKSSGQGPDVQSMLTGVVVRYDDGSGTTHTIGPPGSGAEVETEDLIDITDGNPANRDGANHWELWDAGVTSPAGALILGQVILGERNRMTWRGSVIITDRVRGEHSVWREVAEVNAGDYLIVEDDADTRPRRITSTTWSNGVVNCEIGAPADRLDSLLARLSVVLVGQL